MHIFLTRLLTSGDFHFMCTASRSIEGRCHEASCWWGRVRHPRAWGSRELTSPGGSREALPTTKSRSGPTVVKPKGQMPPWRAERRGRILKGMRHRPEQSGPKKVALSRRAIPLDFKGDEKRAERRANPRAQAKNRGRYSFDCASDCECGRFILRSSPRKRGPSI